jgi:hypothetical protein
VGVWEGGEGIAPRRLPDGSSPKRKPDFQA